MCITNTSENILNLGAAAGSLQTVTKGQARVAVSVSPPKEQCGQGRSHLTGSRGLVLFALPV